MDEAKFTLVLIKKEVFVGPVRIGGRNATAIEDCFIVIKSFESLKAAKFHRDAQTTPEHYIIIPTY